MINTLSSLGLGLPPFAVLLFAAILTIFVRGNAQKVLLIATPIISFLNLIALPEAYSLHVSLFDLHLQIANSDQLSRLFGYLFHLATFIGIIYAINIKDTVQHFAALAFAGCAIGAVFAGDWFSLFLFWEGLALTSVFLIWARRTERSYRSGIRYLIFQVLSGALLFAGALFLMKGGAPAKIMALSLVDNSNSWIHIGSWLIFLAFGIKAGFPLLHTWLTDAYPEATASGTVFMSALTTKVAVYALARCFAGTELLLPIGLTMVCFPIFFAIIENDLRRILAYSMIGQIGFMVCGIGIGTELAINGAVAHAFNDVLFKGVLMMSMGAVLVRLGHTRISDLDSIRLYKSMPKTALLCIIGATAISAVPLMNGFVSKAIIMAEVLKAGHTVGWLLLLFSAGASLHYIGIRVPFFAFFAAPTPSELSTPGENEENKTLVNEAPLNMLIAMSIGAVCCIAIGVYPQALYQLLPFAMDYTPYDVTHVLTQLQLLLFSAVAFVLLYRFGIYPTATKNINIDSDVLYRRIFPSIWNSLLSIINGAQNIATTSFMSTSKNLMLKLRTMSRPYGILSRGWGANNMVFIVILILGILLIYNY